MKLFKKYFLAFLLPLFFSNEVIGQTQFLFRNYTAEKYLSSNVIRCILQDSKGFMWFGTKRGLNRFDGNQVKVFQHNKKDPKSIGSDFIHSFVFVDDKTMWVGTDRGVYILDIVTEKFVEFAPLKGVLVYDLLIDKRGRVWIATYGKGVFCYDTTTKKLRNFDTTIGTLASTVPAKKLEMDLSGNVWIATETRGIIVLNPTSGLMKYLNTSNSELPNNNILTLYKDLNGEMWVGTMGGGLLRFDKKSDKFKVFNKNINGLNNSIVRTIFQPSKEKLFIGTEGGLNVLDLKTERFSSYTHQHNDETSISDNAIYAISGDKEGGIWIGTYFGGINYLREPNNGIERYSPNENSFQLSGRAVSCFLEDGIGNIWIGTEDAGLNYFDVKKKTFQKYPFHKEQKKLPYHNIHVLTKDSKGKIWIGMFSAGLSVYDPITHKLKTYLSKANEENSLISNSIYSIYEDIDKQIWIGTLNGICIYDSATDSFKRLKGTEKYSVFDILDDKNGTMWFVTNNFGLIAQNKKTGEWHRYPGNEGAGSLTSNKLLAKAYDNKGNLWLGTEGGGLNRFSMKKKTAEAIDESKGLPAKVIYSLVLDEDGFLWIATENGLYSLNTNNNNIRFHSIWDGTKSLSFNYQAGYKTSNGKIYFGGINGFGVFHPDSIRKIRVVPNVVLSNFQIFNKDVSPQDSSRLLDKSISYTDKIYLNHNQTVFNIEYAGLSYISPHKINYAYKLDGVDKDWNYVGNQQKASYTNLSPGKYIFKVKVDDGSKTDDVSETTLEIVVNPPFYKTTFFYLIYFLIGITVFILVRIYYRKKNQRENEIKLERLRIENEKEFYNQKIDFFTMMAHEVRTPLSLIVGPIERVLASDDLTQSTRSQLETIDKNADRLSDLVNQLLDFRRIESDFYKLHPVKVDVVKTIKRIYDSFACNGNYEKVEFVWQSSINQLIINTDEEALTKILSNLIINAMKFARSKVIVTISTFENQNSENALSISVEDDGIGIPSNELENIFKKFFKISYGEHHYNNLGGTGIGLALSKALTEKLGGTLNVESELGVSTKFTIQFSDLSTVYSSEYIDDEKEINNSSNAEEYVLIVEDDDELNQFIVECVRKEGFKTISAKNGRHALDLLDTYNVSLIVCDVMMPVMNGLEFCKIINDDISKCHIPVILLTAKTDSVTEITGLENGADAYITKPFKVMHLIARIKNLLEIRKKLRQKYTVYPLPEVNQTERKNKDQDFIERVIQFIEVNIANTDLSVELLSSELGMSKSVLQRKMKALTDKTPNEFIRFIRLQYAVKLLMSNEHRISEIGYMSGFSSPSYFSHCFVEYFKMTPREYIENNQTEEKSDKC